MRLFKLITGGLILLLIGLFIYQNLAVFKTGVTFSLDLRIVESMSHEFTLYPLLLAAGFLGFLIGFFLMLKPFFRTRRLLVQERQNKEVSQAPESQSASAQQSSEPPAR